MLSVFFGQTSFSSERMLTPSLRPSVPPSLRPSVPPSLRSSVPPSVRPFVRSFVRSFIQSFIHLLLYIEKRKNYTSYLLLDIFTDRNGLHSAIFLVSFLYESDNSLFCEGELLHLARLWKCVFLDTLYIGWTFFCCFVFFFAP